MGARSLRSLDFCTGTTREFGCTGPATDAGDAATSVGNLLAAGARMDRYRIVRWLARGAAGTVYEARMPGPMGFSKRVALKVFRRRQDASGRLRTDHVTSEARLAGLLNHPNLVTTHDFGEAEGRYFMAMEYVQGVTLAEMIKVVRGHRRLVPRAAVLAITQQICEGLHHAHWLRDHRGRALGIVHLDLKPANVMVDAGGTVKILDFGVATTRRQRTRQTVERTVQGTPRYMSPEQVTADRRLDHRSDLFSLGAVMYELVTGRPLFGSRSIADIMRTVAYSDARKRLHLAEARLPGIRTLLGGCLDPVQARRFRAAKAVGHRIDELRTRHARPTDLARFVARLQPEVDAMRTHRREQEWPACTASRSREGTFESAGSAVNGRLAAAASSCDPAAAGDSNSPRRAWWSPLDRLFVDPFRR